MDRSEIIEIAREFLSLNEQEAIRIEPVESGLINDTFKLIIGSSEEFILQKVNTEVFNNPLGIQENIVAVGSHFREKDYSKTVLSIVRTKNDEPVYFHESSSAWRLFEYIPKSSHFDVVPSAEHAFEAAKALGEFHQHLADFDSETLTTPIEGFLDFKQRKDQFEIALNNTNQERKEKAKAAIGFVQEQSILLDEYQGIENLLPKRVIHGDPKISNFLFKENSTEVLCLIDWDTIMQGSILYDFGDMIRSFTNRKEESDATDSPAFNAEIFDAIKRGYLIHQKDALSEIELDNLDLGAKTVIYIQAVRFLTDYLNGDTYFRTTYSDQNLDRCNNQIQLLEALLKK